MVDFDSYCIHADAVRWLKTVSDQSLLNAPGLTLRVYCQAPRERNLRISTEEDFGALEIQLYVVSGPPLRGDNQPLERGIGVLNYQPGGFIGGWFCLDDRHFKEVWSQISNATFSASDIDLDVAPVPIRGAFHVWDVVQNPSLYVLGAAVHFSFEKHRSSKPD